MSYDKIQFIAYQLGTYYVTDPGEYHETPSLPPLPDEVKYMTNQDAKARIQRMRDVALHAKSVEGLGGADTLKIFVAPEFYFRQGRYGYADVQTVTNIFSALMKAFQLREFNDWLIIPGTIFWSANQPWNPADEPRKDTAFFNTVCVVHGGFPPNEERTDDEKKSPVDIVSNGTTNQKDLMSSSDFVGEDKRAWDAAINAHFRPIISEWPMRKGQAFQVKGMEHRDKSLTFGLEVCLEHVKSYAEPEEADGDDDKKVPRGALRRVLREWRANEDSEPPTIDIHMVTSCGAIIHPEQVCARAGGFVIICDGGGATDPQICRVNQARTKTAPAVLDPSLQHTSSAPVPKTLEVPGNDGAQQIVIFPATALE